MQRIPQWSIPLPIQQVRAGTLAQQRSHTLVGPPAHGVVQRRAVLPACWRRRRQRGDGGAVDRARGEQRGEQRRVVECDDARHVPGGEVGAGREGVREVGGRAAFDGPCHDMLRMSRDRGNEAVLEQGVETVAAEVELEEHAGGEVFRDLKEDFIGEDKEPREWDSGWSVGAEVGGTCGGKLGLRGGGVFGVVGGYAVGGIGRVGWRWCCRRCRGCVGMDSRCLGLEIGPTHSSGCKCFVGGCCCLSGGS
ncbi:hypothetical protein DFP73DRAFT_554450 [Morchella snyderi]|nr:hypothetical protein DFP73DRAFT_554450 [Morchella snyderi]